ncbi:glycosyltransferase [Microbulbifer hainanensis]|uniref:glycosyltransferase n=1 Tax=Microbulbifer hainanensis TaxID=2735675 RepID=UPI001867A058|nr:glycosyltransferase [Microbulbifer hainanensis]
MRIVQILPELNGGAVEKGVLDFAHELVRNGHESVVISNGGELVSRLTLRGSRHIQLPVHKKPFWSLRLVRRLRRVLLELQPDIIQVGARVPARLTWLAWRGLSEQQRPRLVTTVHNTSGVGFYAGLAASVEQVIAASRPVADYLQSQFGKKLRRPPLVIHRGVNTREFDRSAPISGHWQLRLLNDYPQLEGKNWLLMPARLTPAQGQRTFLQMLAALAQERQDVFGLIVGSGDPGREKYARQLEQLALDLGLSDKVLFLGERRDMRELYASAQITYHLAEAAEPGGDTVAEALAMNCPAIAYRDSAPAEVLQQCFPQGLVERDGIDALLAASLEILQRPRAIDFTGFSLEETTAQTLTVYEDLCQSA